MAKRPNILKLATKISLESMTYTGITYNDPEYKILEPIIDDEMCAIMMHLRLEANRTVEDVAKRAKQSVEYTQTQLDKLAKTGAVRYRYVDGKRCYFYPIWVPGIMEGILANREQCDKYPVLGESFEAYTRRRPEMLAPMLDSGKTGMFFMRVMPVMSAIENDTRTASYDELKTLIENATAISVGPCSCRRARRLMGEGCGHLEEDMCMYLNDNAVCYSEQGYHRLVTKEEAYEILRRAEDNGLVHEINQTPGFEDATAICNCCGCSCFALRIEELFRTPRAIRSNYIARVDKEKCVACGKCAEVCPAGAAKLGQKLCTKTGPVTYPKQPLPDDNHWGEHMWSPNYKDDNQKQCHESGTAPCKTACPAHIAVQGYINLAAQGRYLDALKLIKQDNPFPAVCGSICNRRCEEACTRGDVDRAVAIDEIKKFVAEQELQADKRYIPKVITHRGIADPYPEKIAIIGAGPAGLSCAYYLANMGYENVTVFDKNEVPGGMLTLGIPSFRLEKDVVNAEIEVLREMGVHFQCGVEIGKDLTIDQLREQGYKGFYLAIGAQKSAPIGVPGEDLSGVYGGVDFLRKVNLGKKPRIGKKCAVIGGGNVAMDVCRSAVRLGARKVSCVYRRRQEDMTALPEEVEGAVAEGVELVTLQAPVRIETDANGHAVALWTQPQIIGEMDKKGRPAPEKAKRSEKRIAADVVVVAIGQGVETHGFEQTKIAIKRGAFVAEASGQIDNMDGVFAGGDCVTGPATVIRAIAAGKVAAANIDEYLGFHHEIDPGVEIPTARLNNKPPHGRIDTTEREAGERKHDFKCIECGLTDEEAYSEASRCLRCDHFGYGIFRGGRKGKW